MHPSIQIAKSATDLAAFPNKEIQDAFSEFLDSLGKDLAESGYVEDINTNKCVKVLANIVGDYRETQLSDLSSTISGAIPNEDEIMEVEEKPFEDIENEKMEEANINWDLNTEK